MKALRISLITALLIALTVIYFSDSLSEPSAVVKRNATSRPAPAGALSARSGSATSSQPVARPNDSRPPLTRDPLDCLTAARPNIRPVRPSDPGRANPPRIERDGDVVRLLPAETTPRSPANRDRSHSALDVGNDACPATVIPSLPYHDYGTVAGKHSNYQFSCLGYYSWPDVIYQYTATDTALCGFRLTADGYEGNISVRKNGACPGTTEVFCDYFYGDEDIPQQLNAGTTYYIIVQVDTTNGGGSYGLDITRANACHPDFELTAPGSVSGNTCFANDDCPLVISDDQLVRVTIPHAGRWKFSLCDDQTWQAYIFLGTACCTQNIIANSYYGCPTGRPQIDPVLLSAGVYYVDIEGQSHSICGPWTLTAEEILPCTTRPPNDNCSSAGPPASLPATFTGDNTCATHDCDSLLYGQGETWHAFTVDAASDVQIAQCGHGNSWDYYALLTTGCPCMGHPIIRTSVVDYVDCNGTWGLTLIFRNLQPGTYYYPVLRASADDVDGSYTIHVRSLPTCHIESQPGDVIECMDNPDLSHQNIDCDRGCWSGPAFQPITLGQTVYGRSFTYLSSSNYRQSDDDWYEFTLTDTARLNVTILAEFPVMVQICDRDCDYQTTYASVSSAVSCSTLTFATEPLRPRAYALNVRPYNVYSVQDTLHYRATIIEQPCAWPVVITPQAGDMPEGEPICSDNYQDTYNPGCDVDPPVYMPVTCGETIIGTSGVFHMNDYIYRDTDYFTFTTTEPSILTVTVVAEFKSYLMLTDYCPGCDRGYGEASGYAGDTVRATLLCEPPGNFIIEVLPTDWSYLPCGAHYRMWVSCEPCTPCNDLQQTVDIVENEPPCQAYYDHIDHFNGGCNSDPPAFGPDLRCGQTVTGRSGTYYSSGGYTRDTDWMPITLTTSETPRFCVVAQFPVVTAIVGPGPGSYPCDQVQLYSDMVTGNSCDTVCVTSDGALAPGTYWLFVAPNTFDGVVCGLQYRAWVNCDPCTPNTVSDLVVRRSGDDIVLNWSSDPAFAGTYTIYHSRTCAPWPDGNWEIIAQNFPPIRVATGDTYVHTGAALDISRQYYTIVRVCP